MGLFFILCFLLIRAYSMTRTQQFTVLAIYGALIEWLQAMTGYRSGDIYDWIADALGIVLLFIALDLWQVFTNRKRIRRQKNNG
jgi:VanZ family protein